VARLGPGHGGTRTPSVSCTRDAVHLCWWARRDASRAHAQRHRDVIYVCFCDVVCICDITDPAKSTRVCRDCDTLIATIHRGHGAQHSAHAYMCTVTCMSSTARVRRRVASPVQRGGGPGVPDSSRSQTRHEARHGAIMTHPNAACQSAPWRGSPSASRRQPKKGVLM